MLVHKTLANTTEHYCS